MKITVRQLRQIIREEVARINERGSWADTNAAARRERERMAAERTAKELEPARSSELSKRKRYDKCDCVDPDTGKGNPNCPVCYGAGVSLEQ